MHIRVLGSGAGGGFPQWNCNCSNCRRLRSGELRGKARTQSSIAVSGNGVDWLLVNASPDIRHQLAAFPGAQPGRAIRDTGIRAVLLVDAQIDHTTGLVVLREHSERLTIWCTAPVHEDLTGGYPLLSVLEHYCGVDWHEIPLGKPGDPSDEAARFEIDGVAGLRFEAIPLKSEAPPYSPYRHRPRRGDNIGLWIEDTTNGTRLFYGPGLGEMDARVLRCMEASDCLLVDGTVWHDDEMGRQGIRDVRAKQMGHLALAGPGGMLERLRALERPRKILIHINNTNPILDDDSPERAELARLGIEVAVDGMEITL